jgi:hypothetical protein
LWIAHNSGSIVNAIVVAQRGAHVKSHASHQGVRQQRQCSIRRDGSDQ